MFGATSHLAQSAAFSQLVLFRSLSNAAGIAPKQDFLGTVQKCRDILSQNGVTDKFHIADFARQHILIHQRNQLLKDVHKAPALICFLCGHNAGRSQMAEGWLRHYAGDQVISISGGSTPIDTINPQAVEAMYEKGVDISQHYPKPHIDLILNTPDAFVITMGCGEICTRPPNSEVCTQATCTDWPLPDPHGEGISVVRDIRDTIELKIQELLSELNIYQSKDSDDVGNMLNVMLEKELRKEAIPALSNSKEILSVMKLMVQDI